MIQDGLALRLSNDSGVKGVVGLPDARVSQDSPSGDNGVFPVQAPEAAVTPYAVYNVVAGSEITSFDGTSGLANLRLQVDCYSATYGQAQQLAKAVRSALVNFQGTLADTDKTYVHSLLPIGASVDFFEDAPLEYRTMLEFEVWFNQL